MDSQLVGDGGNDVRSDGVPVGFSMQSSLSLQLVRAEEATLRRCQLVGGGGNDVRSDVHLRATGSTTSVSIGNSSGGVHSTAGGRNPSSSRGLPVGSDRSTMGLAPCDWAVNALSRPGVVLQGSEVTIRKLSGRLVLAMTTENNQSITRLTEFCRCMCASSENIPEICAYLIWKPPVRIQGPGEFYPIRLEATLNIKRIPSDDDFHDMLGNEDGRCLVCYDAAPDVYDGAENCERCTPCALCDNCRVMMSERDVVGQRRWFAVCLQCIEPQEIPLLSEIQAFRRSLVFHP